MDDLEVRYNKLMERFENAKKHMDCYHLQGEKLTLAVLEREKHIPEFRKILKELEELARLMTKEILAS